MQQRAPPLCQPRLKLAGAEDLRFLPISADKGNVPEQLEEGGLRALHIADEGSCYQLVTNGGVR